jgi:hemoglobin-like flavoprotein
MEIIIVSLTQQQISMVKETFQELIPMTDVAADLFYARLFQLDPTLKALFRGNMKDQGRKLMKMLSVAVAALDDVDKILPAVADLGRRHVQYGVRQEHYEIVGEALLWTLEEGLGNQFTPKVKEAWTAVYTLVATTAINAGYPMN